MTYLIAGMAPWLQPLSIMSNTVQASVQGTVGKLDEQLVAFRARKASWMKICLKTNLSYKRYLALSS